MKFLSFFKVGGGFRAEDYANIKHHTEGKWIDWDKRHPPTEFIALAGPRGDVERPDVWIHPTDSIVLEVKGASVDTSDSFKTGYTLRFPRFKKLRMDRDCNTALSVPEFIEVKRSAEADADNKEMKVDSSRRHVTKRLRKETVIAGNDSKIKTLYAGPETGVFEGRTFYIMSDMIHPTKKTKGELEQIVKSNGGIIVQTITKDDVLCISDKRLVKVASLMKSNEVIIVKPAWILDAIKQAEIDGPSRPRFLLPFEPCHMFHITPDKEAMIHENVDPYGDSYYRDITQKELKQRFDEMVYPEDSTFSATSFLDELEGRGKGLGEQRGSMFRGFVAWFSPLPADTLDAKLDIDKLRFTFAAGVVTPTMDDDSLTHVVVVDEDPALVRELRKKFSEWGPKRRLPRMVRYAWVRESWKEGTVLDYEAFAVVV